MGRKQISNKKVLLVTNASVLREDDILHGIILSNRLDASLEVLHLITPKTTDLEAKRFEEKTAELSINGQIEYTQLPGNNAFTREAIDYAKSRRNVLCVILCIKDGDAAGKHRKKFKEITKILSCPVVLYTNSPVYL